MATILVFIFIFLSFTLLVMDRKASGGDLFSKMDKDGSGGISREEFAQVTTCCLRLCFVERPHGQIELCRLKEWEWHLQ